MSVCSLARHSFRIPRLWSRGVANVVTKASKPKLEDSTFYKHTTGRWLFNDTLQREARYTPFDVQALQDIACQSVDATRCVAFTKMAEGTANKVFLLTFDNGAEVVARIPSGAVMGNTHAATASEVATMDYLRRFRGVKTAKVLAWSNTKHNPVGTDYIIMERIPGLPLADRWYSIQKEDVKLVIKDVIKTELNIGAKAFSQLGSLYFKEDVSAELQARPLFLYEEDNRSEAGELYRIGPSTDRLWWRGDRSDVDVCRGPWPNMESQLNDAVKLARKLIETNPNFDARLPDGLSLADFMRLLDRCSAISPYLIPYDPPELLEPILRHPDLQLYNILVAEDGPPTVQGYIDLQAALVAPRFVNCPLPTFAAYDGNLDSFAENGLPTRPPYYEELAPEEKEAIDLEIRLIMREIAYKADIMIQDPLRRLIWTKFDDIHDLVLNMVEHVLYLPSGGRTAFQDVNTTLYGLYKLWQVEAPDIPCPIAFSSEESAAHEARAEKVARWCAAFEDARGHIRCSDDGWVKNEDYDGAFEAAEKQRQAWDEEINGGPFPFKDGSFAPCLA